MISLNNITKQWRWLLCCLFVFIAACTNQNHFQALQLTGVDSANIEVRNRNAFLSIDKIKPLIQQGDLILRTGNDFTSESLRQFSTIDKTYSHCGIASIENDSVIVYHALGGEWNPNEKLRRDPIELFCNPLENRGFGVFNFKFDFKEQHILDSIVKAWYKKGITFDMDFDLKTDDKMYCAEFVSKAITIATKKAINFPTTTLNTFKYVSIDNLYLNKYCSEIKRIRY